MFKSKIFEFWFDQIACATHLTPIWARCIHKKLNCNLTRTLAQTILIVFWQKACAKYLTCNLINSDQMLAQNIWTDPILTYLTCNSTKGLTQNIIQFQNGLKCGIKSKVWLKTNWRNSKKPQKNTFSWLYSIKSCVFHSYFPWYLSNIWNGNMRLSNSE